MSILSVIMGDFQPSLEQKKIILNCLTHQEAYRISQEIADSIPAILLTEICEATAEEREFAIDIQNTVIQRYIQVKGYKELGTKIIGGVLDLNCDLETLNIKCVEWAIGWEGTAFFSLVQSKNYRLSEMRTLNYFWKN